MKTIRNFNKSLIEICQLLSQNATVCKLLYYDTPDALIKPDITLSVNDMFNQHYVVSYPPQETGIDDKDRNTFLVLLLDNIVFNTADSNHSGTYNLYITTDNPHILLNDNKNRMLELADEIIKTLNEVKLSNAGELHVISLKYTAISTYRSSYRLTFTTTDQTARKAEI